MGADRSVGVYGRDNCEEACLTDDDCVAFEIDTNEIRDYCWIHTSIEEAEALEARKGIFHYRRLEDCPGMFVHLYCYGVKQVCTLLSSF